MLVPEKQTLSLSLSVPKCIAITLNLNTKNTSNILHMVNAMNLCNKYVSIGEHPDIKCTSFTVSMKRDDHFE